MFLFQSDTKVVEGFVAAAFSDRYGKGIDES